MSKESEEYDLESDPKLQPLAVYSKQRRIERIVFFLLFSRKMLSRSELGLCQVSQPVGKSYNAE